MINDYLFKSFYFTSGIPSFPLSSYGDKPVKNKNIKLLQ